MLTPSQEAAITKQKQLMNRLHGECEFIIYTPLPHGTGLLRLVCQYNMKNMVGGILPQMQAWTVGKRGKLYD